MMRKIFIWGFCSICVIFLASTLSIAGQKKSAAKADDMCIPMGTIELKAPASVETKRSQVDFPHAVHFSYNCKDCHHAWDGESQIKGCKTSGCHDLAKAPKKSKINGEYTAEAKKYYMYAYHESCRPCHKDIKTENDKILKSHTVLEEKQELKATGPIGCDECHPK